RASTPAIYPLSLHDALPISLLEDAARPYRPGDPSDTFPKMFGTRPRPRALACGRGPAFPSGDNAPSPLAIERKRLPAAWGRRLRDRKSTRLNSSHSQISYAV